jgi:1-aminocyclopropane-1-carboxylate deaminase/D-cysteine desulfhydrase-like pyridoxal-dependent ACC family enzyme
MVQLSFDEYVQTIKYTQINNSMFKNIYNLVREMNQGYLSFKSELLFNDICEWALKFNEISDKQYRVIESVANQFGLTFDRAMEREIMFN